MSTKLERSRSTYQNMRAANLQGLEGSVHARSMKTWADLSDRCKKFCEYVCNGYSITDSYFMAGYCVGKDKSDGRERKKAYNSAYKMMQEPLVRDYIALNSRCNKPECQIDEDMIVECLNAILKGTVEMKVFSKTGEPYYVPPGFRERVMAAETLLKLKKQRDSKVAPEDRRKVLGNKMDELTKSLASHEEYYTEAVEVEEVELNNAVAVKEIEVISEQG